MKNPEILSVKSKVFNRDKITEKYLELDYDDKFKSLLKLLYTYTDESVIIFCNTKEAVKIFITV